MMGETLRIQKIDYPEDGIGIFTYLETYKYPYKGYPDEKIVEKNAILKRCVISTIKLFTTKKPFMYLAPLLILFPPPLRRRAFEVFVGWISELYGTAFRPHWPGEKRLCQSGRELNRVFEALLSQRGLEKGRYNKFQDFCRAILLIWEFDNSYRFRGQDIFSELDKDALKKNPRKEILRLFKIGLSRECAGLSQKDREFLDGLKVEYFDVSMKWKLLVKLLSIVLLLSKDLTNLFKEFFLELNVNEFKFDVADWYWVCERRDYNFGGKPFGARFLQRLRIDEEFFKTMPAVAPPKGQLVLVPNNEFFLLNRAEAENVLNGLVKKMWEGFDARKNGLPDPHNLGK